jgi:hypothetical protein
LDLTFFGLTSSSAAQARFALFSNIHQIVFHGKGGYDYHTVYNMPIWLRKFTFSEIKKHYDEEKQAHENTDSGKNVAIGTDGLVKDRSLFQNQQQTPQKQPVISKPGISPRKSVSYK